MLERRVCAWGGDGPSERRRRANPDCFHKSEERDGCKRWGRQRQRHGEGDGIALHCTALHEPGISQAHLAHPQQERPSFQNHTTPRRTKLKLRSSPRRRSHPAQTEQRLPARVLPPSLVFAALPPPLPASCTQGRRESPATPQVLTAAHHPSIQSILPRAASSPSPRRATPPRHVHARITDVKNRAAQVHLNIFGFSPPPPLPPA